MHRYQHKPSKLITTYIKSPDYSLSDEEYSGEAGRMMSEASRFPDRKAASRFIFLLQIVISLLIVMFAFLTTTKDASASCMCNFSYCNIDLGWCPFSPANYYWRGSEYYNIGGCPGSSGGMCWDQGTGSHIPCSNCVYGYGESDLGRTEFYRCINSCSGGSAGECYGWHTGTCGGNEYGANCPLHMRSRYRYCTESGWEANCVTDLTCVVPAPSCGTVTCLSGGTQARISYTPVSNYVTILRVNKDPYGDYSGPGDHFVCAPGGTTSQTINITPNTNYWFMSVQSADTTCSTRWGIRDCNQYFNCSSVVAPTCTSWGSVRIGGTAGGACDSAEWPTGAECQTTSTAATVYNISLGATEMRHQNFTSTVDCATQTLTSGWVPVSSSRAWTLLTGTGNKKVCGQFRNTGGTSIPCGGMINLVTPTSAPVPVPVCSTPTLTVTSSCLATGLLYSTWSWSAPSGAASYLFQIDNNSDFSSPEVSITTASTSYLFRDIAPGTWYGRVRVATSNGTCTAPSAYGSANFTRVCPTPTTTPGCSCTVNLSPDSASATAGNSVGFAAYPTATGCTVSEVLFSSSNTGVATVLPTSDNSSPYATTAIASTSVTTTQTVNISAQVRTSDGSLRCSDTSQFTVSPPGVTITTAPTVAPTVAPTTAPTTAPTVAPTTAPPCSCAVNLAPDSASINTGNSTGFAAYPTATGCTVSEVLFSSSNTSVATVSPSSDNASPYTTTASGVGGGSTSISAQVRTSDGSIRCSDTSTLSVSNPISCSVSLTPSSSSVLPGATVAYTASVNVSNGTANRVIFSSSNTSVATLSTSSTSSSPYQTTATAVAPGSVTIRAEVETNDGLVRCSSTANFTVQAYSCSVALIPVSSSVNVGSSVGYAAAVTSANGTIQSVAFTSTNSSVASVSPSIDTLSPYTTTASALSPGNSTIGATVRIGGYDACSTTAALTVLAPSCTVNLIDMRIMSGLSTSIIVPVSSTSPGSTPGIVQTNGTVDNVRFSVGGASLASVCDYIYATCPAGQATYLDSTPTFNSTLTGYFPGFTTLTITGTMVDEGGVTCSNTVQLEVENPPAWWQSRLGDLQAGGGGIGSQIPLTTCTPANSCTPYIIIDNTYPGVAIHNGGSATPVGYVSTSGRTANAGYYETIQVYDFDYFNNKLPVTPQGVSSTGDIASCSAFAAAGGYCVLRSGGNLTLSGGPLDIGDRKVVLIVPGDLTIATKINLNDGVGFFMAIARNDILIDPTVGDTATTTPDPDIEGVYFAGRNIRTGTAGPSTDLQFMARGILVARTRVNLERDLVNNALFPGDFIEYAPDQFLHFPTFFGQRAVRWREVAP